MVTIWPVSGTSGGFFVSTVMKIFGSVKGGDCTDCLRDCQLSTDPCPLN
jgi:hypothetical protein